MSQDALSRAPSGDRRATEVVEAGSRTATASGQQRRAGGADPLPRRRRGARELRNPVFSFLCIEPNGTHVFGFRRSLERGRAGRVAIVAAGRARSSSPATVANPLAPGRYCSRCWISPRRRARRGRLPGDRPRRFHGLRRQPAARPRRGRRRRSRRRSTRAGIESGRRRRRCPSCSRSAGPARSAAVAAASSTCLILMATTELQEDVLRDRARLRLVADPAAAALRRPARRLHEDHPDRLEHRQLSDLPALQHRLLRLLPGDDEPGDVLGRSSGGDRPQDAVPAPRDPARRSSSPASSTSG